MKVIKDNYKKFPVEVTCEHCSSVILLEDSNEVYLNSYPKATVWNCPLCKHKNYLEIRISQ